MTPPARPTGIVRTAAAGYTWCLRALVYGLAAVSGAGVLVIMLVTCTDVMLRTKWVNRPFIGAYDIVKIAGTLSLATWPLTAVV